MSAVPVIRQSGEGERMWFAGGGIFTWKATGAETGGSFLMIEDVMERGKVTPYHLHPEQDETVYILDGEMLVNMDGEEHRVGSGGLFFAPRGVPHAMKVVSENARVIAFMTPASGEQFYRDCGETVTSEADESRPPDWPRLRRVAESSPAIEIVGPPPFKAERAAAAV